VIAAANMKSSFKLLYSSKAYIKDKMEKIASTIYGARIVSYEPLAQENVEIYEKLGLGGLPICVAKTHLSLSHDPALKGAPKDFVLPVREIRPSVGAGFLYALCGKILTMPSLPSHPVGECIDVDAKGRTKLCTLKRASKLI